MAHFWGLLLLLMLCCYGKEESHHPNFLTPFLEGTTLKRELTEILIIDGSVALWLALNLNKRVAWFDEPLLETREVNRYTRNSLSYGYVLTPALLLPNLIFFLPHKEGHLNSTSYRHAKGAVEATLIWTPLFTEISKIAVGKKRPGHDYALANHPDLSSFEKRDLRCSFWSAHSSGAFSVTTYANLYMYRYWGDNSSQNLLWKIPFTLSSCGLASWVAQSRVAGGKHDILDVAVGGVVGATISTLLFGLHDNWFFPFYNDAEKSPVSFQPDVDGFSLVYSF